VVQQPIDGGGGEGFGHDGVEAGWVDVGADRHGTAFVGGVDESVEGFACFLAGGQGADVIDHDELGPADPVDDSGGGGVEAGSGQGGGEGLEREPADPHAGVDDGMGERFAEMRLPGARRDSDRLQQLRAVLPCEVRVTSVTHPLFGGLLAASGFKRRGGVLLLVVTLVDGSPGTIRADATDILGGPQVTGEATVMSVVGLRALRELATVLASRGSPSRSRTRK
jgi:hypothetical protein